MEEKTKQMKGEIKHASHKLNKAERHYRDEMDRHEREMAVTLTF